MTNWYDTAQICLNGHIINWMAQSSPERNQKFCGLCGIETIIVCQNCGVPIRGYYHMSGVYSGVHAVPKFCHNCGNPYPWTASKLKAAQELAGEAENLKPEERELLKQSLDDLVRNTANTQVAALRFKKLVPKAGKVVAEGLRDILVDIASETAKKILFSQT